MAQPNQGQSQINIELSADLEAIYSNFAIISHSPSEIVDRLCAAVARQSRTPRCSPASC